MSRRLSRAEAAALFRAQAKPASPPKPERPADPDAPARPRSIAPVELHALRRAVLAAVDPLSRAGVHRRHLGHAVAAIAIELSPSGTADACDERVAAERERRTGLSHSPERMTR
jgi:hypothetical protein